MDININKEHKDELVESIKVTFGHLSQDVPRLVKAAYQIVAPMIMEAKDKAHTKVQEKVDEHKDKKSSGYYESPVNPSSDPLFSDHKVAEYGDSGTSTERII